MPEASRERHELHARSDNAGSAGAFLLPRHPLNQLCRRRLGEREAEASRSGPLINLGVASPGRPGRDPVGR
jgi:hypothetical protein